MKKTKLFIAMTILTAAAALSSCGAANAAGGNAGTSSPTDNVKVTFIETTGEGGLVGTAADEASAQEHGEFTETLPALTTIAEQYAPGIAQHTVVDDSVPAGAELTEDGGEKVQTEYSNRVFIITANEGTPYEKINELIEKYGLEIIYDYEDFNMYALATPDAKNEEQTWGFVDELMSYDFILNAEPDAILSLSMGLTGYNGEETTVLDPSELETTDLGESLGEFKDDSYWERMLDKNSRPTHSDKVFLICVEPDTPEYVMNDFIEKYGFTVIYDYENLNMYALEAPEPKSEEEIWDFCKELESYNFILSAEPDGIIYLDDPVSGVSLF